MRIRIFYEDTDCGGIVYHANYIKFCERARSNLFFENNSLPESSGGFVVSEINAKFLGTARLGDELFVKTKVDSVGKIQVYLTQEIFKINSLDSSFEAKNAESNLIFKAFVRLGFVDYQTKKPTAIPQDLKNLLISFDSAKI